MKFIKFLFVPILLITGASRLSAMEAAKAADMAKLEQYIAAICDGSVDVDHIYANGHTALSWTTVCGRPDCIQLLIERGATVNLETKDNHTALLFAAMFGKLDCIIPLIQAGATVNHVASFGYTPLIGAAMFGYTDCVRFLIAAGANVFHKGNGDKTALVYASEIRRLPICELLVEKMLSIKTPEQSKRCITFLCCMKQLGLGRDVRSLFKAPLLALVPVENSEDPHARAFQEIEKIKNEDIKKQLLDKYKKASEQSGLCSIQ